MDIQIILDEKNCDIASRFDNFDDAIDYLAKAQYEYEARLDVESDDGLV